MELTKAHQCKDKNRITEIVRGSIAEKIGIEVGDILIAIDEIEIHDIIEYKFLISEQELDITIEKNGMQIIYEIDKEYDEDLGIVFSNPLIDKASRCKNNCMFCFIDQLPKGMRETLYFKDDDSRLSFLQGNFITLTNLDEDEITRIINYRISPINISVHTTDPELRVKMLKNPKASKVLEIMKRFADAEIEMDAQIVAIPGINDKENLDKTFYDLLKLYPNLKSVAVVPVGLTKYREELEKLEKYNFKRANEMLEQLEDLQKIALDRVGSRFIFPSDEFYILANKDIPKEEEYEGYPLYENGVGLVRVFDDEVSKALKEVKNIGTLNKIEIATGTLAYDFINKMTIKVKEKFDELRVNVHGIENQFFGTDITVSGLVTGQDIYNQLKDKIKEGILLIPKSMLKYDELIFLDDMTVEELSDKLNIKVEVVDVDGYDFVNKLLRI